MTTKPSDTPIAVVGVGCRFPGAGDVDAYWALLRDQRSGIRPVPESRWRWQDYYDPSAPETSTICFNEAGFLVGLDEFDWEFFGLSEAEAARLDPQQKLALTVAWEALESAGIVPKSLAGSYSSVIMGVGNTDHARKLKNDIPTIDGDVGPHCYDCFVANRLSYFFNLTGPSYTVNAACASSLSAIHLACQSLRLGDTDLVVSGGVNVHVLPEESISCTRARWLSAEGRCKSFREGGDGYVRGEGCGVVVLKRLADAERDGNPIWGVIRGSALSHNGLSNGITVPNGASQSALIQRALAISGLAAADVSYLEAHGTGSSRGDSMEAWGFMDALGPGRAPDQVCRIGCAKPNIGHTDAASGVAGLIKVLLSMRHDAIPGILHLDRLNRWIELDGKPFRFVTEAETWPRTATPRRAGVSNFAFGGANAVIFVEDYVAAPAPATASPAVPEPRLVGLGARTDASLDRMIGRFADALPACGDDGIHTANVGRTHFPRRVAVVADSPSAMRAHLDKQPTGSSFRTSDYPKAVLARPVSVALTPDDLDADLAPNAEALGQWWVTRAVLDDIADARDDGAAPTGAELWLTFLRAAGVRIGELVVTDERVAELAAGALAHTTVSGLRNKLVVRPDVDPSIARGTGARPLVYVRLTPNARVVAQPDIAVDLARGGHWQTDVLAALGQLYCLGHDLRWQRLSRGRLVSIPTYPFEPTHSWFESSVDIVEKPAPSPSIRATRDAS